MSTPKQELADALSWLKQDPRFRVFVHHIAVKREAVVAACLAATTSEEAEPLRLEARAFTKIIKELKDIGVQTDASPESST